MPNPQSLICAYPPNILSSIIQEKQLKQLHVYIDLKNVLTALFVEDVVKEIVLNSQTMNNIDSSIFQSIINISSYWKNFAYQRGMSAKVFICSDVGKSCYHSSIYKRYKHRRDIMNTSYILGEKIKKIRDKNFLLAELICNKIPNVYFFCLKYLESDFLPYYLITRKFKDENIFHIVCSNDKDLYQSLLNDNIIQIYRLKGTSNVLTKNSILNAYLKIKKLSIKSQVSKLEELSRIDDKYIVAMMAVRGDDGDDIPGVKGIGPAGLIKIFSQTEIVNKLIGTPEELDDRIHRGGKFFKEDQLGINQLPKIWKKIFLENDLITQAYKLISFESLSRWVEDKRDIQSMKYIKYMDKLLIKDGIEIIPTAKSFLISLQIIEDLYLTENIIYNLFNGE